MFIWLSIMTTRTSENIQEVDEIISIILDKRPHLQTNIKEIKQEIMSILLISYLPRKITNVTISGRWKNKIVLWHPHADNILTIELKTHITLAHKNTILTHRLLKLYYIKHYSTSLETYHHWSPTGHQIIFLYDNKSVDYPTTYLHPTIQEKWIQDNFIHETQFARLIKYATHYDELLTCLHKSIGYRYSNESEQLLSDNLAEKYFVYKHFNKEISEEMNALYTYIQQAEQLLSSLFEDHSYIMRYKKMLIHWDLTQDNILISEKDEKSQTTIIDRDNASIWNCFYDIFSLQSNAFLFATNKKTIDNLPISYLTEIQQQAKNIYVCHNRHFHNKISETRSTVPLELVRHLYCLIETLSLSAYCLTQHKNTSSEKENIYYSNALLWIQKDLMYHIWEVHKLKQA